MPPPLVPHGLLHGTLDTLVLKTLSWGARHGYGIARWIEETTDEQVIVEEGSLYPALYRMEAKGWIKAAWGFSENNRKAKFYELTAKGRKQLATEESTWARLAAAIGQVLKAAD